MKRIIYLLIIFFLLSVQISHAEIFVPDIHSQGYDFILEIAGYVIQRSINTIEGYVVTRETPGVCKTEIVFDTVYGQACRKCCQNLNLISFIRVRRISDAGVCESNATINIATSLSVTKSPKTQLIIRPLIDTIKVTADPPDARRVEEFIISMKPEIERALTLSILLEGLDVFAASRPANSSPVSAAAYELGLQWVLQIYGPMTPQARLTPEVFLIGDSFTIVLTKDTLERLTQNEFAAGRFPARMSDSGLVDPEGRLRNTGVSVELGCGFMNLNWVGVDDEGNQSVVQWRMGFINGAEGLSLEVSQIFVNGESKQTPEGLRVVNPMNELIRSIAIGSEQTPIFIGPLGRVKLTSGAISPAGIIVGGRA